MARKTGLHGLWIDCRSICLNCMKRSSRVQDRREQLGICSEQQAKRDRTREHPLCAGTRGMM